jgi:hypothetical protein
MLRGQRSHLLLVLSDAKHGHEAPFRAWYGERFREDVAALDSVLGVWPLEQHSLDITGGHWPRPPKQYLCICELVLDGAEQAEPVIDRIADFHARYPAAQPPATWLYYPAGESVGRGHFETPLVTVAFANAVEHQDAAFREWYVTRHIRHALLLPALVGGQCFERTAYQKSGSLSASYSAVAIYAQEGTPEVLVQDMAGVPSGALRFPSLDLQRFAECSYQALALPSKRSSAAHATAAVGG